MRNKNLKVSTRDNLEICLLLYRNLLERKSDLELKMFLCLLNIILIIKIFYFL